MKYLGYTIKFQSELDKIDQVISETQEVGCNFYTVVPHYNVPVDNSPSIYPGHDGPSYHPDSTPEILEKLRSAGVTNLMIKPQIHPNDARGQQPSWWPGYVAMDNKGDWEEFFANYLEVVDKWIDIAKRFSVYNFIIGTELCSTLKRKQEWQNVFRYIRNNYGGNLAYGSNFWQPLRYKYYCAIKMYIRFHGYKAAVKYLLQDTKFTVPDDLANRVGRNIFNSNQTHNKLLDKMGVGGYYWNTFDKPYTERVIRSRWESVHVPVEIRPGKTIELDIRYIDAVKSWHKKYNREQLWFTEADVVEVPHRADFDFYCRWWKVFFDVWEDKAELIQVWEDGKFGYWVKAMREIR